MIVDFGPCIYMAGATKLTEKYWNPENWDWFIIETITNGVLT